MRNVTHHYHHWQNDCSIWHWRCYSLKVYRFSKFSRPHIQHAIPFFENNIFVIVWWITFWIPGNRLFESCRMLERACWLQPLAWDRMDTVDIWSLLFTCQLQFRAWWGWGCLNLSLSFWFWQQQYYFSINDFTNCLAWRNPQLVLSLDLGLSKVYFLLLKEPRILLWVCEINFFHKAVNLHTQHFLHLARCLISLTVSKRIERSY